MKTRNLLLLLALPPMGCFCSTSPGDGEKVGTIVKLSKVGMACSTWEGQLIRGGMNGGSGSFGVQPFDFTIEDLSLVSAAQEALEKQTELRIHYRTEGVFWACRNATEGHFLTSIQPAH